MPEDASMADSKERALLYDMWRLLKGESQDEVKMADVKLFLMTVVRLCDHPRIGIEEDPPSTGEDDAEANQIASPFKHNCIGFFNSRGQFCLRIDDIPILQKHYDLFYLNRLQFLGKKKTVK